MYLNLKRKFLNKAFKEIVLVLIAIFIGLISTMFIHQAKEESAEEIQQGLANSLIRFHVIANSDSDEDQALKLKVRDTVLKKMQGYLKESNNIDLTRQILFNHIDEVKAIAEEVIKENDYSYKVKVSLGDADFPTKTYGDIVLPAGKYEALRIEIGNADGRNWWCVMFPPLCFVDVSQGVVPEKSKNELKNILTEEEYDSVLMNKNKREVKVKFKLVELIEKSNEKQKSKKTNIFAYIFGGLN